jgi:Flp pilus assembly protein TadB
MQMDYAGRSATTGSGRVWSLMIRLAGLLLAGAVLLAVVLVGLFVVLPIMLVGGIALSFYLRRRLRRAQRRQPEDGVIDAEYTVIERR